MDCKVKKLLSLFFIFCFILSVNLQTVAQNSSPSILVQPNKPKFKPKIEEKKVRIPMSKPIEIKVSDKSRKISKIVKNYPLLKNRTVTTNSLNKDVKKFVSDVDKLWVPPIIDNDIIITYDVTIAKNKIVKRNIIYSNTTKEIESIADNAMKMAELYLKGQRRFFKRKSSFKIYFIQEVDSSSYKEVTDIQSSNIIFEPIQNAGSVSGYKNDKKFSPYPTLHPYSEGMTSVQNAFPIIDTNNSNNYTLTSSFEPEIAAFIYEYDTSINMYYVPPSIMVKESFGLKNRECYSCRYLENVLMSNWVPVQDSVSRNVIFDVRIDNNKSLKYTMLSSSSDPSVDNAALLSLYNAKISDFYYGYYNPGMYTVKFHSGAPEQPDFDTYLQNLSKQLKSNWKPYSKYNVNPVEVIIAISDKGEIFSWGITKSSGDEKQDDSVINSILLTQNLEPLPENYRGDYVKLKLIYKINEVSPVTNTSNNSSYSPKYMEEPDFGPYMRELQRRIIMNWDPPKGNESKRVVLLFKIAKDGRLLSCSVFKSSGLQKADSAALNAVKLAAPFRPLPPEYKKSSIDVQFTFDYNVFGPTKY